MQIRSQRIEFHTFYQTAKMQESGSYFQFIVSSNNFVGVGFKAFVRGLDGMSKAPHISMYTRGFHSWVGSNWCC